MPQAKIEYAIPLSIRDKIQANQEEQAYLATTSAKLLNYAHFVAELSERAPGGIKPPTFIWLDSKYSGITLCIFVTVPGFTLEAAPRLVAFLEFISDQYENPPVSQDNAASGQRLYSFQCTPESSDQLNIRVHAELVENSENCQRIITGTRKVQKVAYVETDEPIYAFKC